MLNTRDNAHPQKHIIMYGNGHLDKPQLYLAIFSSTGSLLRKLRLADALFYDASVYPRKHAVPLSHNDTLSESQLLPG